MEDLLLFLDLCIDFSDELGVLHLMQTNVVGCAQSEDDEKASETKMQVY